VCRFRMVGSTGGFVFNVIAYSECGVVIPLVAQESPEFRGCMRCWWFDCVRTRFRLHLPALGKAPVVLDTYIS
jgi:hypothetical protein